MKKEETKKATTTDKPTGDLASHEEIVGCIKKAVQTIQGDFSKEDKKRYAKVLLDIAEKGKTPAEAMQFQKSDLALIYNYAYSFYNKGDYKTAIELYKMLVTLDPTYPSFSLALGVCYQQMKEYKKAIVAYTLAYQHSKNDPIPYYYLYDCYLKTGDQFAALMMINQAIIKAADQEKYKKIKERSQKFRDDLSKEISKEYKTSGKTAQETKKGAL